MTPKLIVEQRITAFVNQYSIYAAQPDGKKGNLLAFAQQKRFAFKEKVTFYANEAKTQIAFTFRAEKVLDVHGSYLVEDADGKPVGSFKKDFAKSLLNSTWTILGPDQKPRLSISESNKVLAILRRYVGFIPILGDLFELVMIFFRYHFVFVDIATKQEVGRYQKTALLRDHYVLLMTDAAYAGQDWRVLAAMGVGLDALQSR